MNKELNKLTDQTIIEISKLEIVLPEIYKDIFYTKANELGIKIDKKEKERAMIYALKKIEKLKNETQKTTTQLKENIQKARIAINKKDDTLLLNIEKEVIKLEKTIINLEENLYIDELTNVYNRRWLYEKFLKDEKFQQDGAFAFLDIDEFKSVNDNYGHLVGDKVLQTISRLLKRIAKSSVIRFAGDEFILLSKNKIELSKLLENARKNLKNTQLKHKNKIFSISFSFGVLDFKKGDDFRKIFKKSDDLMYYYKESR